MPLARDYDNDFCAQIAGQGYLIDDLLDAFFSYSRIGASHIDVEKSGVDGHQFQIQSVHKLSEIASLIPGKAGRPKMRDGCH